MILKIEENIKICNQIFSNCDIDYHDLMTQDIDEHFFQKYENTRIINSFLFNFAKLQDKIGAKLFRDILYELKEIDTINIPMIDILNYLEKLNIIEHQEDWESLRELRNLLSHEYPFDMQERCENILLALDGYSKLKTIYKNLLNAIK